MPAFRFMFKPADYAATVAHYRDIIGLPIADSWENDGGGTLFQAGGGQIEVFGGSSHIDEPPSGTGMAIEVPEDIDEMHSRLAERGAAVTSPPTDRPWGHRSFSVVDLDGIPITFFRELQ